jgi:hypothetical protein
LSQYAIHIGFLVVGLIAAAGAWALLRNRRPLRREDPSYRIYVDFQRTLEGLRREFQQSITTNEAAASRTSALGERVIAAVKPIEAALRHLRDRMYELERRVDSLDETSVGLKSLLEERDRGRQESEIIEDKRYERFEQQLSAMAGQLSSLKRTIDDVSERNGKDDDRSRTLESSLAAFQGRVEDMSLRLTQTEDQVSSILSAIESMAQSIAGLKLFSEQAVQNPSQRETPFTSSPREPIDVPPADPNSDQNADGGVEDATFEQTTDLCHRAAVHHGGGGRGPRDRAPRDKRARRPKLQLIATCDSGAWQIFAELDGTDVSNVRLVQGDIAVEASPEMSRHRFGPLQNLIKPIRLVFEDENGPEWPLLTSDSPLIFQVKGDFARLVPRRTAGMNFALVPDNWHYNELKSGPPPSASEATAIRGYVVHFFSSDRNPTVAFDRPDGSSMVFSLAQRGCQLIGRALPDAEESMGSLFAGQLPALEGDTALMEKVRTIVVGVEGRGPGRWREAYTYPGDTAPWQLPSSVPSGWYLVRLYDTQDRLIDSIDFRYIAGLKSIDVKGGGPTGGFDATDVRVTFRHDEGTSVQLGDSTLPQMPHTPEMGVGWTAFEWRHHPDIRRPVFEVRDGGQPVLVTIDTDIIWWALIQNVQLAEPAWQASPIELTAVHFAPESDSKIVLRFPRSSKFDAFIGFTGAERRKLLITDKQAFVQLYGFGDAPELQRFGKHSLKLWIRAEESEMELEIGRVISRIKCSWCEYQSHDESALLDHLLGQHHERFFEQLKLRGEDVDRPDAIFVCLVSDCGQYYPESRLPEENPISRLSRHSNERHHSKMAFKKISSPQDINNLLGLHEKWVWRCNLGTCRPITPKSEADFSLSDKKAHLREEHWNDLLAAANKAEP